MSTSGWSRAGAELVVTERGVPIARVVPLDDAERKSTRRLRLARAGLVKPGRGPPAQAAADAAPGEPAGDGVLHALLAERGDTTVDR